MHCFTTDTTFLEIVEIDTPHTTIDFSTSTLHTSQTSQRDSEPPLTDGIIQMGAEVPADSLGDEWKGYIFRITGGNDKQGFPMKQGVMHPTRVRLLLSDGHSCYRPRRTGERKRKSVRGCIVGMDLSVLALAVVKQGEQEIPGLTDVVHPKRLGPKRATKIRKFFGLTKEDDVRCIRPTLYNSVFACPMTAAVEIQQFG